MTRIFKYTTASAEIRLDTGSSHVARGSVEASTPLHALSKVLDIHPTSFCAIVQEEGQSSLRMRYLSAEARSKVEGRETDKPLIHVLRDQKPKE